MKKLLILFFCFLLPQVYYAQVGINTSQPNANTLLHVSERVDPANGTPNKYNGVMLPRYTTAERDANFKNLTSADNGLSFFNKTTDCYNVWNWDLSSNSGSWSSLCGDQVGMIRFTDCSTIKVVGAYDIDKAFNLQNVHIDIPVFVTKLGSFNFSVLINGIKFSAEGNYVNKGSQIVSLFPSSGTTSTVGTYSGNILIAPTEAQGSNGVTCQTSVIFKSRKTSVMKIVNVTGTLNNSSLISGSNYNASSGYAPVGTWLTGGTFSGANSAVSYAGTQSISVVNVIWGSSKLRDLQLALEGASIVWLGASQDYSNGAAQLIKEWYQAGNGVVMITADKEQESIVADALGYYVGDGDSQKSQIIAGTLPQVFDQASGAPFNVYGLNFGYSGANAGYISANRGLTWLQAINGAHPMGYADISSGGAFIFGDKFGDSSLNGAGGGDTTASLKDNFAKALVDIFVWSLKNAPVH